MASEMILEVEKVVSDLSEEMLPALEDRKCEWMSPLTYKGYSGGVRIYFAGEMIWSSEEDLRTFDETKNDYEPLRAFVVRQMVQIVIALMQATYTMEGAPRD